MRARLLLDAELVLWALAAPARLARETRALLDASEVYVSAATILEIGLHAADGHRAADVLGALEPSGFGVLAVSAEHAALAAGLAGAGPDPFDRLLLAQASLEGMTLVTTDPALAAWPAEAQSASAGGRGRKAGAPRRPARSGHGPRRPRPAPERCRIVLAVSSAARRRTRG